MTPTRPRTVTEMAIYVEGIERSINEKMESFDTVLGEIKETQHKIVYLVVSCIVAPIIIAVVTAVLMNGKY